VTDQAETNDQDAVAETVISALQGPVIRLATVCESIIEEVGTHTTSIIRMIDAVDFSAGEVSRGDTFLPGYVAFMGYGFPGEEETADVLIFLANEVNEVLGGVSQRMTIQGPQRAFAFANQLAPIRIPTPGRYVLGLAYQDREIARAHLRVQFASPVAPAESAEPPPDG
jgi:hypothetical protein